MIENTLKAWHQLVATRDAAGLDAILADDVVFHSPIVHTPQAGKPITTLYLTAAVHVLNNETFRYVREVVCGQQAVLEFMTEIEGITINGVDMITWGADGRITDFKVMVRPLKAIQLVHRMMGEMLQSLKPN
jgi:ketosteroid isomerase-like protein